MKASLDSVRALAQRDADREGKPLVIYNLNRFSTLYVIRTDTFNAEFAPGFVERVQPTKPVSTDRL